MKKGESEWERERKEIGKKRYEVNKVREMKYKKEWARERTKRYKKKREW